LAESNQILTVSDKHEGILNYLVTNPGCSRLEVAEEFGVTRAWLSTVIHSDVFQAKLRERQDEVFTEAIVAPIQDKLLGAAHMATERLMELLPYEGETNKVAAALDTTLKNLGYGQRVGGVSVSAETVNVVQVSPDALARARTMVGAAREARNIITEDQPLEGKAEPGLVGNDVSEVREGRGRPMGQARPTPALPGPPSIDDPSLPAWSDL